MANKKKKVSKRKFYYLIAGILIAVIVLFFAYKFNLFFQGPVKDECQIIVENSGENKVDIVFFTNNITADNIQEYIDFFFTSTDSLSNNKEKFNFYYAGETDCEIIEEKAIYCYSKKLLRKSSICPNDFIIVLSNSPKKMRSSAYMNVMSLNTNNNKNVMLHEFGHVFTNLADEYAPSIIPYGSKNCVSECNEFEKYGDLEGCYLGCSKADYHRSSEKSIMRTLKTNEFGKLNEILIIENLDEYE